MANLEDFRIPQYEGCRIYAIVNSQKMSCYIGSSKNIKLRAINHKAHLKKGKHHNKLLQKDFENGNSFRFIILCKLDSNIDNDLLIAYEKMYMISAMDNYFELYNLLPKTQWNNQRSWIIQHIIYYFMNNYKISENLISAFEAEYETTPAYMHNRKPENR